MKKTSLTPLSLLVTLTLVLSLDVAAQQNARAEKPKDSDSLERSLDQLGRGLKESVAIECCYVKTAKSKQSFKQAVRDAILWRLLVDNVLKAPGKK